jgi:hypothetical protein
MFGYRLGDVKKVADGIGMDIRSDKKDYLWFLKSALTALLPREWQKEIAKGKTYYHNFRTLITTEKHPLLYKLRYIFNRMTMFKAMSEKPIL